MPVRETTHFLRNQEALIAIIQLVPLPIMPSLFIHLLVQSNRIVNVSLVLHSKPCAKYAEFTSTRVKGLTQYRGNVCSHKAKFCYIQVSGYVSLSIQDCFILGIFLTYLYVEYHRKKQNFSVLFLCRCQQLWSVFPNLLDLS